MIEHEPPFRAIRARPSEGAGLASAIAQAASLTIGCGLFLASAARYSDGLIDDAYIVFRYADNLVAGFGPVFNRGEWVEGFSSPLWLLLVAAARALGAGPERAAIALGIVFGLGAILATWALARRMAAGWPALIAPLLLAVHPAHALWSVHGLETPLFVLLVAAAFCAWAGDRDRSASRAGILFGLGFWTRPEAPLFVAILAGVAVVRRAPSRAVRLIAGFLALALPLVLLRLLLYHSLVPNTFHAKTGGGAGRILFGLGYARLFVQSHGPLVAACAFASGLIGLRVLRERGASPAAARSAPRAGVPPLAVEMILCGLCWSAWVVWIGGDAFPGYRFWLPVLPLAGALAGWLASEAAGAARTASYTSAVPSPPTRPIGRSVLAVLVSAAGIGLIAFGARPDVEREFTTGREFTARMLAAGDWLRAHAPADTTIALNYVGAVPYRSGLRALDMLGLTDPVVGSTPIPGRFRFPGHARGNGASILDRKPGLILMGGVHLADRPMTELSPELDSEEQIAADPRFPAEYERIAVPIPGPPDRAWFSFYERRDLRWSPDGALRGQPPPGP